MLDRIFSIPKMIITLVFIAFMMTLFTGYQTWVSKNTKNEIEDRNTASAAAASAAPATAASTEEAAN